MGVAPRRLTPLDSEEALRLVATISLGRIVFTAHALPAIRPVNHVVDDGDVVIRTHTDDAVVSAIDAAADTVVAYEADTIDPVDQLGWMVVITGVAHLVTDAGQLVRYERTLQPWVTQPMGQVIRVHPQIVTGFRLIPANQYRDESPASI
ncbi:pyridoxamine 5'-phosphate oxidase family protein [Jiangella alkaliphila]|uniref:Pyridoxamine 5'-phosphate oxidase n=1 Tax=Jiangella alkaliphila TaxID=419479 RepID=A0A1H2L702_9ACTN|nr:pyridoxamine 5'-phosphate oxidase family protein [Jiangella alkaliphila]SDU76582.1 Pyridoxamine 5'-phosphate oxidase [Jiangella alkaliphila]